MAEAKKEKTAAIGITCKLFEKKFRYAKISDSEEDNQTKE
jgi:transcription elongation GreA/GreB family factor